MIYTIYAADLGVQIDHKVHAMQALSFTPFDGSGANMDGEYPFVLSDLGPVAHVRVLAHSFLVGNANRQILFVQGYTRPLTPRDLLARASNGDDGFRLVGPGCSDRELIDRAGADLKTEVKASP